MESLPCHGEYLKSAARKYKEVVVMVPFFGGKKPQLKRHADFLNSLGYDCVVFELMDEIKSMPLHLVSSSLQLGMKHVWTDQIESVLNQIPENKIIFAFSNPCGSAIEAVARRKATDIKGLVCDSGPSAELWSSMMNYFSIEQHVPTYPLRALTALAMTTLWHPKFGESVHHDLNLIPKGFQILSIRGWKDKLISPQMIDKIFEPHTQLDWQKLSLPQAEHLTGLKDFSDEYVPAVGEFLKRLSTVI